jgi:hypothetical protein
MTSVRSLANLHCTTCGETTLHRSNQCIRCDTVSAVSGNPPVPRPSLQRRTAAGEARRIESLRAHHAAKKARNQWATIKARSQ